MQLQLVVVQPAEPIAVAPPATPPPAELDLHGSTQSLRMERLWPALAPTGSEGGPSVVSPVQLLSDDPLRLPSPMAGVDSPRIREEGGAEGGGEGARRWGTARAGSGRMAAEGSFWPATPAQTLPWTVVSAPFPAPTPPAAACSPTGVAGHSSTLARHQSAAAVQSYPPHREEGGEGGSSPMSFPMPPTSGRLMAALSQLQKRSTEGGGGVIYHPAPYTGQSQVCTTCLQICLQILSTLRLRTTDENKDNIEKYPTKKVYATG